MVLKDNIVAWPILLPDPAASRELKPLLDLIATQIQRATDFTTAAILSVLGQSQEWYCPDCRGALAAAELEQFHHALLKFLLDKPVTSSEPIFVNAVPDHLPLWLFHVGDSEAVLKYINTYARSWMVIPLVFEGRLVGFLSLTHSRPAYFTPRHAKLALAIFNQAFQAHSRLAGRAQTAAVLEERQRIARELHDSVTQVFYGISLAGNAARTLLERGETARVNNQLTEIINLAEAGLIEMRALLFELRPESLRSEGLVAALFKQTEALRVRHDLKVEAELGSEPDVPFEVKEALCRIAQESFQNTIRHARATTVRVKLEWDAHSITLETCDNGRGFDPSAFFPGHLGLVSMRERAALLGGSLEITSSPTQGTRVHIVLSLTPVASH